MSKSLTWLTCCILSALSCYCQTPTDATARTVARSSASENAESIARDYFVNGDYDKAVPVLEAALTTDPKDLNLLNVLGMAYLYSSSRIDMHASFARVQPTMEKVIEGGGSATFVVSRAIDKMKTKFVVKAVPGDLAIAKESMTFTPAHGNGETIGPISKDEVKECGLNRGYGKDSNTFHIKTTSQGELNFRPLHFSKDEVTVVCSLAAKYWGIKLTD